MPSPPLPYSITNDGEISWDAPRTNGHAPVYTVRGSGYTVAARYWSKQGADIMRIKLQLHGAAPIVARIGRRFPDRNGVSYTIVDSRLSGSGLHEEADVTAVREDVYAAALEDLGRVRTEIVAREASTRDVHAEPVCRSADGPSHAWNPVDDPESDADICLRCGCVREPACGVAPEKGGPYTYQIGHYYVSWPGGGGRSSPIESPSMPDAVREAHAKSDVLPHEFGTYRAYYVNACHCSGGGGEKACEMHADGPYNIALYSGLLGIGDVDVSCGPPWWECQSVAAGEAA